MLIVAGLIQRIRVIRGTPKLVVERPVSNRRTERERMREYSTGIAVAVRVLLAELSLCALVVKDYDERRLPSNVEVLLQVKARCKEREVRAIDDRQHAERRCRAVRRHVSDANSSGASDSSQTAVFRHRADTKAGRKPHIDGVRFRSSASSSLS